MALSKLYKDSCELGFNDRDFPTDISPKSCQALENAFPGAPNLKPRHGIDKWNTNADALGFTIYEIIEWSERDGIVIIIDTTFRFWVVRDGAAAPELIGTATGLNPKTKFHWVRNQASLFIITNYESNDASYIIEETSSGFVFRNGNIVHTPGTISKVDLLPASPLPLPDQTWAMVYTLVRRTDDATPTFPNDYFLFPNDAFVVGDLESVPTVDDFQTFVGNAAINFDITVTLDEPPDPQVTHVRVYMTLLGPDTTTVLGLEKRWVADLPIDGDLTFRLFSSKFAEMAGSFNFLKTIGFDRIPAGSFITYHQGRLWIGAKTADEEFPAHRGRWYYSSTVQDADAPLKWASMWQLTTDFKDTSLDDQEDISGMGIYDNDLVFIMERDSVWRLRNGDVALQPERISSTKGSRYPWTITKVDEMLFYLSNEGPAYVEGDAVNTMREFTSHDVWPEDWKGDPGTFFTELDPHDIRAFYFRSTWWIHHKHNIVGMYMPVEQKGFGPMRVVPAWTEIIADRVAVLGNNKAVMGSNHLSGSRTWNFLNPDVDSDNGYDYKIRMVSKDFYVNQANPDMAGELYDILVHLGYTDAGRLRIRVLTDNDRVLHSVEYTQADSGTLVDSSNGNSRRNVIQQGFLEGLIGRVFRIEITKEYRDPYDFHMRGFSLRLHRHLTQDFEYQADEIQDDVGVHDALTDQRTISDWEAAGRIKDAGDNTRTLGSYTVRDAGDDTTRLLPS